MSLLKVNPNILNFLKQADLGRVNPKLVKGAMFNRENELLDTPLEYQGSFPLNHYIKLFNNIRAEIMTEQTLYNLLMIYAYQHNMMGKAAVNSGKKFDKWNKNAFNATSKFREVINNPSYNMDNLTSQDIAKLAKFYLVKPESKEVNNIKIKDAEILQDITDLTLQVNKENYAKGKTVSRFSWEGLFGIKQPPKLNNAIIFAKNYDGIDDLFNSQPAKINTNDPRLFTAQDMFRLASYGVKISIGSQQNKYYRIFVYYNDNNEAIGPDGFDYKNGMYVMYENITYNKLVDAILHILREFDRNYKGPKDAESYNKYVNEVVVKDLF